MSKIYKAFQSITPNEFDKIIEQCKYRDEEVQVVMETPKKRRSYKFIAAALVCLLVIGLPLSLSNSKRVYATVGLDVNPSIELNLNKKEQVINIKAMNEDGQKILRNMDLEGQDLELAMNAIIGSMLKQGYIDELKNSLLVSVAGASEQENEQIRQQLTSDIDMLLKKNEINGSIVSQVLLDDDKVEELAKKYHISKGKAELIEDLIEVNPKYTFESLKDLSVNDLNILLKRNNVNTINVSGQAATGNYINKEEVKRIVLNDAKLSDAKFKEIELDYDNGHMVYEVELIKGEIEYEYDVDAKNGDILKKHKEVNDNDPVSSDVKVTKEQVKSIALNHAGVSQVQNYTCKLDQDDYEYDIEFVSAHTKYEYSISSINGKILNVEKETVKSTQINSQDAKEKALLKAQLKANQVSEIECELENQGYYEVTFKYNGYEYEYHVDGQSGKIIKQFKEKD